MSLPMPEGLEQNDLKGLSNLNDSVISQFCDSSF